MTRLHFLRQLARKTWAYFETHVGPDDHWLPPDNVQEIRRSAVAHRTSPTNMGLALLANLAAHDFGYLSTGQLVERTTNALRTMESLERHRGHFYNWYDTQTLLPLAPRYISTVDSGNLAGHLLTLRPGLAALADAPILNRRWLEGMSDTYAFWSMRRARDAAAEVAQFAQFESALGTGVSDCASDIACLARGSMWTAWLRAPPTSPRVSRSAALREYAKAKSASGPRRWRGNVRICAMS